MIDNERFNITENKADRSFEETLSADVIELIRKKRLIF